MMRQHTSLAIFVVLASALVGTLLIAFGAAVVVAGVMAMGGGQIKLFVTLAGLLPVVVGIAVLVTGVRSWRRRE